MQSSPPNRPWKAAGSPAGSQYSINLAALDLDAQSDDSGEIPKPKTDRIFSEDIDGPSDFTQNMEHWLRGGTSAKGTLRSVRGPVETIAEAQETAGDLEDHRPSLDETHDENDEEPEKHDARSLSNHTPMGTPPRISISQRSNADGHFSSVWDPYGITSTPFPREQNGLLQPTVEDYHSELTPARPTPQRSPAEAALSEHDDDPIADSPLKIPESSPPSAVRGSIQRQTTVEPEEISREREALIVKPWQVKCEQLQRFNDAVQAALDEERRLRNADSLEHEAEIAEADRQERHHAELYKKLQLEIEVLRRERDEAQAELARERNKPSDVDVDQTVRVQQLTDALEQQAKAHAAELASCRTALETAQNSQRESEDAAQRHQSDLDSLNDLHNAEMGRLRLEVQNAKQDESTIANLEQQLQTAHAETERLRTSLAASRADLGNLQTQLTTAQASLSEETTRYTTERTRAIDLAAELQRQMQDLRQQLRAAQAAHDADLARLHLRSEEADAEEQPAAPSSPQDLATLRAAHDAQTTALNEAVLDRDAAQDTLEQSRDALTAAEAALADAAAVSAAMDARVAETLRTREKSWRERWAAAERERRVMAKALLHQWGREEVGRAVEGEAQMYAYKYPVRAGKGEDGEGDERGAVEGDTRPRRCKTCQRRPSRSRSTLVGA